MRYGAAAQRLTAKAIRLVGQTVTIRRVTVGTYSTTTGTVSTQTEDFEVMGRLDDYLDRELSDTIKKGDRKLTVAAVDLDFVAAVTDQVLIDSKVFAVKDVQREVLQDEPVLYVMQLRG